MGIPIDGFPIATHRGDSATIFDAEPCQKLCDPIPERRECRYDLDNLPMWGDMAITIH